MEETSAPKEVWLFIYTILAIALICAWFTFDIWEILWPDHAGAVVGFAGVIATLLFNAWLQRHGDKNRQYEERKNVEAALIAELFIIKAEFTRLKQAVDKAHNTGEEHLQYRMNQNIRVHTVTGKDIGFLGQKLAVKLSSTQHLINQLMLSLNSLRTGIAIGVADLMISSHYYTDIIKKICHIESVIDQTILALNIEPD